MRLATGRRRGVLVDAVGAVRRSIYADAGPAQRIRRHEILRQIVADVDEAVTWRA